MDTLSLCEYQKICRICLKNDVLVSIYSPTFLVRPVEMLEKLNILRVPLENSLPALLCQSCLYRLLDAYNLQQLAEASDRRLKEYFGLSTSSSTGGNSILNCNDLANSTLPNTELMKPDTDCSSASMYANICDMFDRQDVTNDMVEVVGTDDVELLNEVEIDVSSLTRSEAEESLGEVFMSKTKLPFTPQLLTKNLETPKIQQQQQQNYYVPAKQVPNEKHKSAVKRSQKILRNSMKKSLNAPDKCLECGKVFHYKGYLEIHRRVHTGDKPFKCQVCSREFITSNKLLLHQRTHNHSNEALTISLLSPQSSTLSDCKRFQCEICSAFFSTSSNLKSHKFTHSNKREYQCNICLLTFKSPRDLKRHEPAHKTNKDIHCTICEKLFTKRASLNAHMITVHRRVRKHKCNDCDKIFGKRSNLINHMRIHSGEKPFECPSCAWKFAQSSALRRHMKKHEKSSITGLQGS